MIDNDVLRSIRYMLDLSDIKVAEITELGAPGFRFKRCQGTFRSMQSGPDTVLPRGPERGARTTTGEGGQAQACGGRGGSSQAHSAR